MAVKVQAERAGIPDTQRMEFRIPGVEWMGNETIAIQARPVVVEWQRIEDTLKDSGIPYDVVPQYVERIARIVESSELARFLAENMERVG